MTDKENNNPKAEEEQHTSYELPPIWKTNILEQVEIARQFPNPIRHELLKRTLKEIREGLKLCPEEEREKLELAEKQFLTIIERLHKAAIHFEGFKADEIEVCLNTFASECYKHLHADNLNQILEGKIQDLSLDEEKLHAFLTLKLYQYPAEKYDAEAMLSRVGIYKRYLQAVLSYYKGNVPRFIDPSKASDTNNDMDKEVFLVEELELRLSIEAVRYKRHFDGFPPVFEFDPQHFNKFITGPLLNEYIQTIYERTKKLNNHEINRYLNISYSQFQTHKPALRKEVMKEQYWKDYCYPNPPYMPFNDKNDRDKQYFEHFFGWYEKHFHLFEEATKKFLYDFRAGISIPPSFNVSPPVTEKPQEKIKWTGTPKEFVQTFQALIENGTLQFKGNSDAEPIVRLLYNTFRIDKAKGEGEISLSTLSTYFKKEKNGDTY